MISKIGTAILMFGYTKLYTESFELEMHTPSSFLSLLNSGHPLWPKKNGNLICCFFEILFNLEIIYLPAWTLTSVNIIPFDNFVILPSYTLGESIFDENVEKYGNPIE